jgi:hypothetical protein
MRWKCSGPLLAVVAVLTAVRLSAAENGSLLELRANHNRALAALQSNAAVTARQSLDAYGGALDGLEQEARNAGYLVGTLTLAKERARFAAQPGLTRDQLATQPESLRRLQERVLRSQADQERKANRG